MASYLDNLVTIENYLRSEFGLGADVKIQPTTSVSNDLGIDSDDLSFLVTRDLEKMFGKKLGAAMWNKLETVEEIAKAFAD